MKCGDIVWKRGLLRRGYGICHGVAGNAYVFLALFKETGNQVYLHRALKVIGRKKYIVQNDFLKNEILTFIV